MEKHETKIQDFQKIQLQDQQQICKDKDNPEFTGSEPEDCIQVSTNYHKFILEPYDAHTKFNFLLNESKYEYQQPTAQDGVSIFIQQQFIEDYGDLAICLFGCFIQNQNTILLNEKDFKKSYVYCFYPLFNKSDLQEILQSRLIPGYFQDAIDDIRKKQLDYLLSDGITEPWDVQISIFLDLTKKKKRQVIKDFKMPGYDLTLSRVKIQRDFFSIDNQYMNEIVIKQITDTRILREEYLHFIGKIEDELIPDGETLCLKLDRSVNEEVLLLFNQIYSQQSASRFDLQFNEINFKNSLAYNYPWLLDLSLLQSIETTKMKKRLLIQLQVVRKDQEESYNRPTNLKDNFQILHMKPSEMVNLLFKVLGWDLNAYMSKRNKSIILIKEKFIITKLSSVFNLARFLHVKEAKLMNVIYRFQEYDSIMSYLQRKNRVTEQNFETASNQLLIILGLEMETPEAMLMADSVNYQLTSFFNLINLVKEKTYTFQLISGYLKRRLQNIEPVVDLYSKNQPYKDIIDLDYRKQITQWLDLSFHDFRVKLGMSVETDNTNKLNLDELRAKYVEKYSLEELEENQSMTTMVDKNKGEINKKVVIFNEYEINRLELKFRTNNTMNLHQIQLITQPRQKEWNFLYTKKIIQMPTCLEKLDMFISIDLQKYYQLDEMVKELTYEDLDDNLQEVKGFSIDIKQELLRQKFKLQGVDCAERFLEYLGLILLQLGHQNAIFVKYWCELYDLTRTNVTIYRDNQLYLINFVHAQKIQIKKRKFTQKKFLQKFEGVLEEIKECEVQDQETCDLCLKGIPQSYKNLGLIPYGSSIALLINGKRVIYDLFDKVENKILCDDFIDQDSLHYFIGYNNLQMTGYYPETQINLKQFKSLDEFIHAFDICHNQYDNDNYVYLEIQKHKKWIQLNEVEVHDRYVIKAKRINYEQVDKSYQQLNFRLNSINQVTTTDWSTFSLLASELDIPFINIESMDILITLNGIQYRSRPIQIKSLQYNYPKIKIYSYKRSEQGHTSTLQIIFTNKSIFTISKINPNAFQKVQSLIQKFDFVLESMLSNVSQVDFVRKRPYKNCTNYQLLGLHFNKERTVIKTKNNKEFIKIIQVIEETAQVSYLVYQDNLVNAIKFQVGKVDFSIAFHKLWNATQSQTVITTVNTINLLASFQYNQEIQLQYISFSFVRVKGKQRWLLSPPDGGCFYLCYYLTAILLGKPVDICTITFGDLIIDLLQMVDILYRVMAYITDEIQNIKIIVKQSVLEKLKLLPQKTVKQCIEGMISTKEVYLSYVQTDTEYHAILANGNLQNVFDWEQPLSFNNVNRLKASYNGNIYFEQKGQFHEQTKKSYNEGLFIDKYGNWRILKKDQFADYINETIHAQKIENGDTLPMIDYNPTVIEFQISRKLIINLPEDWTDVISICKVNNKTKLTYSSDNSQMYADLKTYQTEIWVKSTDKTLSKSMGLILKRQMIYCDQVYKYTFSLQDLAQLINRISRCTFIYDLQNKVTYLGCKFVGITKGEDTKLLENELIQISIYKKMNILKIVKEEEAPPILNYIGSWCNNQFYSCLVPPEEDLFVTQQTVGYEIKPINLIEKLWYQKADYKLIIEEMDKASEIKRDIYFSGNFEAELFENILNYQQQTEINKTIIKYRPGDIQYQTEQGYFIPLWFNYVAKVKEYKKQALVSNEIKNPKQNTWKLLKEEEKVEYVRKPKDKKEGFKDSNFPPLKQSSLSSGSESNKSQHSKNAQRRIQQKLKTIQPEKLFVAEYTSSDDLNQKELKVAQPKKDNIQVQQQLLAIQNPQNPQVQAQDNDQFIQAALQQNIRQDQIPQQSTYQKVKSFIIQNITSLIDYGLAFNVLIQSYRIFRHPDNLKDPMGYIIFPFALRYLINNIIQKYKQDRSVNGISELQALLRAQQQQNRQVKLIKEHCIGTALVLLINDHYECFQCNQKVQGDLGLQCTGCQQIFCNHHYQSNREVEQVIKGRANLPSQLQEIIDLLPRRVILGKVYRDQLYLAQVLSDIQIENNMIMFKEDQKQTMRYPSIQDLLIEQSSVTIIDNLKCTNPMIYRHMETFNIIRFDVQKSQTTLKTIQREAIQVITNANLINTANRAMSQEKLAQTIITVCLTRHSKLSYCKVDLEKFVNYQLEVNLGKYKLSCWKVIYEILKMIFRITCIMMTPGWKYKLTFFILQLVQLTKNNVIFQYITNKVLLFFAEQLPLIRLSLHKIMYYLNRYLFGSTNYSDLDNYRQYRCFYNATHRSLDLEKTQNLYQTVQGFNPFKSLNIFNFLLNYHKEKLLVEILLLQKRFSLSDSQFLHLFWERYCNGQSIKEIVSCRSFIQNCFNYVSQRDDVFRFKNLLINIFKESPEHLSKYSQIGMLCNSNLAIDLWCSGQGFRSKTLYIFKKLLNFFSFQNVYQLINSEYRKQLKQISGQHIVYKDLKEIGEPLAAQTYYRKYVGRPSEQQFVINQALRLKDAQRYNQLKAKLCYKRIDTAIVPDLSSLTEYEARIIRIGLAHDYKESELFKNGYLLTIQTDLDQETILKKFNILMKYKNSPLFKCKGISLIRRIYNWLLIFYFKKSPLFSSGTRFDSQNLNTLERFKLIMQYKDTQLFGGDKSILQRLQRFLFSTLRTLKFWKKDQPVQTIYETMVIEELVQQPQVIQKVSLFQQIVKTFKDKVITECYSRGPVSISRFLKYKFYQVLQRTIDIFSKQKLVNGLKEDYLRLKESYPIQSNSYNLQVVNNLNQKQDLPYQKLGSVDNYYEELQLSESLDIYLTDNEVIQKAKELCQLDIKSLKNLKNIQIRDLQGLKTTITELVHQIIEQKPEKRQIIQKNFEIPGYQWHVAQSGVNTINSLWALFQRFGNPKIYMEKDIYKQYHRFTRSWLKEHCDELSAEIISMETCTVQDVIQKMDPCKQHVYIKGLEQLFSESHELKQNWFDLIQKPLEHQFKNLDQQAKPRQIFNPQPYYKVIAGLIDFVIMKAIHNIQARDPKHRILSAFVHGVNMEQLAMQLNLSLDGLEQPEIICFDGYQHDSNQHKPLITTVDTYLLNRLIEPILLNTKLECARDQFYKIANWEDLRVKFKVRFNGRLLTLVDCWTDGTVPSGATTRTTIGNTYRVISYSLFTAHLAKIELEHNLKLHQTGDDTMNVINSRLRDAYMCAMGQVYFLSDSKYTTNVKSTVGKEAMRPKHIKQTNLVNYHGLGQVAKTINFNLFQGEYLSKDIFLIDIFLVTRKPERFLLTGQLTDNDLSNKKQFIQFQQEIAQALSHETCQLEGFQKQVQPFKKQKDLAKYMQHTSTLDYKSYESFIVSFSQNYQDLYLFQKKYLSQTDQYNQQVKMYKGQRDYYVNGLEKLSSIINHDPKFQVMGQQLDKSQKDLNKKNKNKIKMEPQQEINQGRRARRVNHEDEQPIEQQVQKRQRNRKMKGSYNNAKWLNKKLQNTLGKKPSPMDVSEALERMNTKITQVSQATKNLALRHAAKILQGQGAVKGNLNTQIFELAADDPITFLSTAGNWVLKNSSWLGPIASRFLSWIMNGQTKEKVIQLGHGIMQQAPTNKTELKQALQNFLSNQVTLHGQVLKQPLNAISASQDIHYHGTNHVGRIVKRYLATVVMPEKYAARQPGEPHKTAIGQGTYRITATANPSGSFGMYVYPQRIAGQANIAACMAEILNNVTFNSQTGIQTGERSYIHGPIQNVDAIAQYKTIGFCVNYTAVQAFNIAQGTVSIMYCQDAFNAMGYTCTGEPVIPSGDMRNSPNYQTVGPNRCMSSVYIPDGERTEMAYMPVADQDPSLLPKSPFFYILGENLSPSAQLTFDIAYAYEFQPSYTALTFCMIDIPDFGPLTVQCMQALFAKWPAIQMYGIKTRQAFVDTMFQAPDDYEPFLDYMDGHRINETLDDQPVTTMVTSNQASQQINPITPIQPIMKINKNRRILLDAYPELKDILDELTDDEIEDDYSLLLDDLKHQRLQQLQKSMLEKEMFAMQDPPDYALLRKKYPALDIKDRESKSLERKK